MTDVAAASSRGRARLFDGRGLRPDTAGLVERMGLVEAIGQDNLFLTDRNIFGSVRRAVARGRELAGEVTDRAVLREEPERRLDDYSI